MRRAGSGAWTGPDTASESTGCRRSRPNRLPPPLPNRTIAHSGAHPAVETRYCPGLEGEEPGSAEAPVAAVDVQDWHAEPVPRLAGPVGVEGVLHGVRLGDDDDFTGLDPGDLRLETRQRVVVGDLASRLDAGLLQNPQTLSQRLLGVRVRGFAADWLQRLQGLAHLEEAEVVENGDEHVALGVGGDEDPV